MIKNTTPFVMQISSSGDVGTLSRASDNADAAGAVIAAATKPEMLPPGYQLTIPVGSGGASFAVQGNSENVTYLKLRALEGFVPVNLFSDYEAITGFASELSDDASAYAQCRAGAANFIESAACSASFAWNVNYAVSRLDVEVGIQLLPHAGSLGALLNLINTTLWAAGAASSALNFHNSPQSFSISPSASPTGGGTSPAGLKPAGPPPGGSSPSTPPAGAQSSDCEALVTDVTMPDGTAVSPGQTFDKTWRLRNCGSTNWSALTAVRVTGNYGPASFTVPVTAPGATNDVTVSVTAPTQPGLATATYRLQAPDGHYADNSFWVEVNVVAVSPSRQAITNYDQMRPGAPYHGYFVKAWQSFAAASNTITWISATVGNPAAAAGSTVPGSSLLLRICTNPNCTVIIAEAQPEIVNYGETGADIGDIAVTQGTTYYLVWYQPSALNGSTWVTYWWGGGNTISTSDLLEAAVRGYDK